MPSSDLYIVEENLPLETLGEELRFCTATGQVVGLDCETTGINPKKEAAAAGALTRWLGYVDMDEQKAEQADREARLPCDSPRSFR